MRLTQPEFEMSCSARNRKSKPADKSVKKSHGSPLSVEARTVAESLTLSDREIPILTLPTAGLPA